MAKNSLPRPLAIPVADAHHGLRDIIRRTDQKAPRQMDARDASDTPPLHGQIFKYDSTTGLMVPRDEQDIIFDYPGAFATVTSARVYPKNTYRISGLSASLGTTGSSTTTVSVSKNGSTIATVNLGSGVAYGNTLITPVTINGRTDYWQITISAVGTGAVDLAGAVELG